MTEVKHFFGSFTLRQILADLRADMKEYIDERLH
jgi:hypothetical protein